MAISPADWSRRVQVTGQAPVATISGFVALLTEACLPSEIWSIAENGGGDLRVCTDKEGVNQLPLEVVKFDTVAQSAVLWVRFSTYESGSTGIWLFYGKPGETQPASGSTFGTNSVWSDFEYVFHFPELNRTVDSTGRYILGENGTITHTPDLIGDGGINGNGSSGNYGYVTGYAGPSGSQNRTHSFWMKTTTGDAGLIEYGQNVNSQRFTARLDGGKLRLEVNGGYRRAESTVLNDDIWHLCVIKANGESGLHNAVSMSIDGVAESSYAAAGSPSLNTNPLTELVFAAPAFGRASDSQGEQWLRLFTTTDEQDTLEYINQYTPNIFWTVGTPEDTVAAPTGTAQPIVIESSVQYHRASFIDISSSLYIQTSNGLEAHNGSVGVITELLKVSAAQAQQSAYATVIDILAGLPVSTVSAIQREAGVSGTLFAQQVLNALQSRQDTSGEVIAINQFGQLVLVNASQTESGSSLAIAQAAAINASSAVQSDNATPLSIEQAGAQFLNLISAEQSEKALALSPIQKQQLASIVAKQLSNATSLNLASAQAVSFVVAKQVETASGLMLNQYTDQIITLVGATQQTTASPITITSQSFINLVSAMQNNTALALDTVQHTAIVTVNAAQLEYANILGLVGSNDLTSLDNVSLVPLTETYSLSPINVDTYTLEEI